MRPVSQGGGESIALTPALIYDDEEALEALTSAIIELHESLASKGVCYKVEMTESMRKEISERITSVLVPTFCTVFGQSPSERFPDVFAQVGFFAEHLAKGHIFDDGNKRTTLIMSMAILRIAHINLTFEDAEDSKQNRYYLWIQDIVSGKVSTSELVEELRRDSIID